MRTADCRSVRCATGPGTFACVAKRHALSAMVLAVALAGWALPATANAATELRRFVAWQDGRPAVTVDGRRNGSCDSSSYVNPRLDAWRCIAGHFIYDPCFENLAEEEYGELLCVASPWARSGRIMFSALDYDDRFRGRRGPWALEMSNGRRCIFVSGASDQVRGRRLNYVCRLSRPGSCPCGYGLPPRTRPYWRLFVGGLMGRGWHTERVRYVWR
jgi:hypothetical protein